MNWLFSILAGLALLICFILIGVDFWRFFASQGDMRGLSIDGLLGQGFEAQLASWAALEDSTWGNINRLLLRPPGPLYPALGCIFDIGADLSDSGPHP